MALCDIKATESGKHDWLLLYFLILPIISNTQTHNDYQQRTQKLRSHNQTGLSKGQTVFNSIGFSDGSGLFFHSSEDSHCPVLPELLRTNKTCILAPELQWVEERKWSVSFSLGFIQYFLHYLSMLPSWRPENSTWSKSASQFPPKVQTAALMAVFYLPLFFLMGKIRNRTRMSMQHYESLWIWLLVAS